MSTGLSSLWHRVEAVLNQVLDASSPHEAFALDAATRERVHELSGDQTVAQQVLRILEETRDDDELFDRPITEVVPGLFEDLEGAADANELTARTENPRLIDRYRLLSVLGRGGMGVVYRAERADDQFQKEVALKLLPMGLETPEGRRRLLIERQILARLEHPGIARLLDGGVTEEGTPYLVMELIDGRPIDAACVEDRLSTRERVELFLEVCAAVDYAHRNLVLHRDLKPTNCLVTPEGRVKLLDFGIGKLISEDASDGTVVQPLTPRFASPEQLRNEPVSVASDIYALGLLLDRLLTGTAPFELDGLDRSQMLARVESKEPSLSSSRATGPSVARQLRGDLDRIIAKALELRPENRYGSVRELAEDLERHLDGRPVQARPITWRIRAVKFMGRHRVGVVAVGLLTVLVAVAVGSVIVQGQVAAHERDRARIEAQRAQRVTRVLTEVLASSAGDAMGSGERTAREMLEDAEVDVRAELASDPVVLASMLEVLAVPHITYANDVKSLSLAEEAVALLEEQAPLEHLALARARTTLASVRADLGRVEGVEEMLHAALEGFALVGEEDSVDAASAHRRLGSVLLARGETARALEHSRAALARFEAHGEAAQVAIEKTNIAMVLRAAGRHQEAIELNREALAYFERVYGADHSNTAGTRNNLANSLMELGHPHEAAELYRQALATSESVFGSGHRRNGTTLTNLARALLTLGELEEAEVAARRAVKVFETGLVESDHPSLIGARMNLASVELALGNVAEARALYEEGYRVLVDRLGDAHGTTHRAASLLALARIDAGQLDEAAPLLEGAVAHFRNGSASRSGTLGEALVGLAQLAALRGHCSKALALLSEAGAHLADSLPAQAPMAERRSRVEVRCSEEISS
ncbi:MAG: hypothetical protein DWQ30_19335 [Acidobacteria bacterium]|nr:MAG: hypothetical protein DWQ30_19335 [Acidobacteriota bacterium]